MNSDLQQSIVLAHGGGGQLTDELLSGLVLPRLGNDVLGPLLDAGIVESMGDDRPALTLDGYVVQPWRFPGGDIGRLAMCGTINDLAVCGAEPIGVALGLIIAEGFSRNDLAQVLDSIAAVSNEADVSVITGDTKVVGRNQADGIYITTAGIGRIPRNRTLSPKRVAPGDVILVNGPVGEHGLAVMLTREMPEVQSVLTTDAAPLNGLIRRMLDAGGEEVKFMRDPTRSGVSGVVADLAQQSGRHVTLNEADVPVRGEARHAAEMLGLDPLEVANEGKVVAVVAPDAAERVLGAMHAHPFGREATAIGRIDDDDDGIAELFTVIGGRRVLQKPYGEQLPRIC